MLPVTDATIDVYYPGDETPTLTVDDRWITEIDYSERLGHRKDTGRITLTNDGGQWTDEITSGARLACQLEFGGPILETWGGRPWGDGVWGGDRLVWTALVRDRDLVRRGPSTSDLRLECQDFAFGVMDLRETYAAFDDQRTDTILATILDDTCPELEWHIDRDVDTRVTATYNGTPTLAAVDDLLINADAVARGYGDHVMIRPFEAPDRLFTATDDDIGQLTVGETDELLINEVRVNGSRGDALDPAATEEAVSRTRQVSSQNRLRFQIPTRKSEVSAIELYTKRRSEDTLIVRLQKDDDGTPIAPGDRASDIAHNEQPHHFIAEDGWTEIPLPSETLPEPNPWVIVESGGDLGHGIGVTGRGQPARRVYYPYHIAVSDYDSASIARYRRRQDSVSAENASLAEARDIAAREIARKSQLQQVVECEADSRRTHMLRPGEVVALPFEREGVGGDFIVSERMDTVTVENGIQLETSLTFEQQFDTALDAPEL